MDRLLEATARAEKDHFWFRGFRRFITPMLAEAVRHRPGALILDCGCGTGHNLALLRRYGCAVGIDLNWRGLVFAHDRGERAVAQASATSLPFPDAHFDVVTSFDVIATLEIRNEAAALGEMFRVLRPGGHLVLNVAAMNSLTGNHSILAEEVRRYSRGLLGRRLREHGFGIRRLTYTNASILPIVFAVRTLQRFSGHAESEEEITIPARPINAALSAVLALEAAAVRAVDMPLGSSLLAFAQKPESNA